MTTSGSEGVLAPGAPTQERGAEDGRPATGAPSRTTRVERGLTPRQFLSFVVIGTVLGALLGGAAGWLKADTYAATSTVLVAPLEGNPFSPVGSGDDLLNLETEAQLVLADDVTDAVADKLGGSSVAVRNAVEVEVPTNTQMLRITFHDSDPDRAVRGAQTYAESFLDFREGRGASAIDRQAQDISRELAYLNTQLQTQTRRLAQLRTAPQREVVNRRIEALNAEVVQLQGERASLGDAARDPGQVVYEANRATRFPVPWWVVGLVVGALVGAFIGAVLGVSVNNRRLRGAGQPEAST